MKGFMNVIDGLNFVNAKSAAVTAFKALNGVQDNQPAEQLLGVGICLLVMCEELQIKPQDLLLKVAAVVRDADQFYAAEIKALRMYTHTELKGKIL